LYSTAGIHPHDAKSFGSASIANLSALASRSHVVAVGECGAFLFGSLLYYIMTDLACASGLDFDRDFSPRDVQERVFVAQIELALSLGKPLFCHERSAHQRFLAVLTPYAQSALRVCVHCFTGSTEELKAYLARGYYIGASSLPIAFILPVILIYYLFDKDDL